ncbi:MAG: amidase [Ignavibacteriae bacterium]|nr:MAG: amidase [Ignavibacteriota bacterium]
MKQKNESGNRERKLSRRGFVKSSFLGSFAAAALPSLMHSGKAASDSGIFADISPFELEEITIAELVNGMASGNYTSRSILEKYLARIEDIDRHGPALRSVIELNPDARSIADALDRERKEKGVRGPLHGIPVLIKDNIDTADRMATTAGSLALVGSKPPADSFLVQQLRRSGALILGKTNLSEWANIRSSRSTSGWSGRGGLTKNPYALDRNTSGSSSGSAASVSANLCAAAVGTETDGSIVSPSSINGIVGIKPTVGLISRTGVIPISHTQDTPGPMARTVRDAAILLGALAGFDEEDKATRDSRGKSFADYTPYLNPKGLEGSRIGVVRKYFGFHPGVDRVINDALNILRQQGATLIDPADIPTIGKFDEAELNVLLYELKADLNAYFARLGADAPVHTLKELIDYNERHAQSEMPYFGQELFLKAEAKGPLSSKEYIDALKQCRRLSRKEGIDATMKKFKLDALVAPTDSPAWLTDLVDSDHFLGGSSTMAAVAGYPSITVPAGFVFGLPVGISFFGRAWSEPILLKFAYAFEQASRARKRPEFLPTAEV